MAETIGLGASVVTFIGLAGKLARGCSYVRTTIDEILDAPDDLRALQKETRLFAVIIENFHNALLGLEESGIPADKTSTIESALGYGEDTLADLVGFIKTKTRTGNRWGRIRFVLDKAKCAKYVDCIEQAGRLISAAQVGIILSLEHENILSNRVTHRALGHLTSNVEQVNTDIGTIPSCLDRIAVDAGHIHGAVDKIRSNVSDRIHGLPIAIDAILSRRFNAVTTIVAEALGNIDEVRHTKQQRVSAARKCTAVSDGLNCLPMGMSELVKDTIRGVLVEFYLEGQTQDPIIFGDSSGECQPLELKRPSGKVTSQHRITRRYERAIGIISVRSITTNFAKSNNHGFLEALQPRTSTVTQTYVELYPNPELIRIGVYCLIVQHRSASILSIPEPRLQVYNFIDSTAPIVAACLKGDLPTATNLQGVVTVFEELVNHGLDPGVPRTNDEPFGKSTLGVEELNIAFLEKTSEILKLARIVLKQSFHDPLLAEDILSQSLMSHISGVKTPLLILLQTQEDWHAEWPPLDNFQECREYFLKYDKVGSLIHSRLKDPNFWHHVFYANTLASKLYLKEYLFNAPQRASFIFSGHKKPSCVGDWVVELLAKYGTLEWDSTSKGWMWISNILEFPLDCEDYGMLNTYIWQGISSYIIEPNDLVHDLIEEELYSSLAFQLINLSFLTNNLPPRTLDIPKVLHSKYFEDWQEDLLVEHWIDAKPEPHDQHGRFGPVNSDEVYSTLQHPFRDGTNLEYHPSLFKLDENRYLKFCEDGDATSTAGSTTTGTIKRSDCKLETENSPMSSLRLDEYIDNDSITK